MKLDIALGLTPISLQRNHIDRKMFIVLNPSSAGTVFIRQNLTSQTHNIGIQMNQKKLTKTFMMISNLKNTFGLHDIHHCES